MVARTLDSTNFGVVWDNFHVFQGHRANTPYIQIGRKGGKLHDLKLEKHPNAIKQSLKYQGLLESGQVDSQSELARRTRTPRTTISAYLRLLGLSEEVRAEALSVADDDDRISVLTEARLRHLVGREPNEQHRLLKALLKQGGAE
jgi:hypothetical protein